jgi:hypothetical protein
MVGGCRWHENLLGGVDLDDGVGERLWGLLGKVVAEPPWMVRCEEGPENLLAEELASGCGAPLASPSRGMVGTAITGPWASCSSSSWSSGSPSATLAASDSCESRSRPPPAMGATSRWL